jgi:hypothetical protein
MEAKGSKGSKWDPAHSARKEKQERLSVLAIELHIVAFYVAFALVWHAEVSDILNSGLTDKCASAIVSTH